MIAAPLPENEERRLERLKLYKILDTPPEDAFDRITRIVAETIGVPISLVSLVDENRQWFKSRYGLGAQETPRELAFCAHAILGENTFVVEDTFDDERFKDNPLVTGGPEIRFYAGAILKTSQGFNLGTLCAIDQRPRKLSKKHKQLLEDLSYIVVNEMELRLALQGAMSEVAEEVRLRNQHDEFFATINHELRTPLTSINGSLGLLASGVAGVLPEKAKKMVDIAIRNSENLLGLIGEILEMQKINAGKMTFEFNVIDVQKMVVETCENLKGYGDRHKVAIEVVYEGGTTIIADYDRLSQALNNLISNAIKFSPENGTVWVKCRNTNSEINIDVIDQGPGVAPEFENMLFKQFSQASSPNKSKGTGLGLAISKNIIQAHQGQIGYRKNEGQGAVFSITLPILVSISSH